MISLPSDFKCKFCCCWRFRIWRNTCVCLVFFVQFDNLSLIRKFHHNLWRAANFDLCLALLVIERWGFLSVPHLLWHDESVYNGHLRGSVTLTSVAESLAAELSLPVLTTLVCRRLDSNTQTYPCKANAQSIFFI